MRVQLHLAFMPFTQMWPICWNLGLKYFPTAGARQVVAIRQKEQSQHASLLGWCSTGSTHPGISTEFDCVKFIEYSRLFSNSCNVARIFISVEKLSHLLVGQCHYTRNSTRYMEPVYLSCDSIVRSGISSAAIA